MAQLFLSGTSWGTLTAGSVTDLTKHVALTAGTGFSITSGRLNIVIPSGGSLFANVSGTDVFRVSSAGVSVLSGTLAAPGMWPPRMPGRGSGTSPLNRSAGLASTTRADFAASAAFISDMSRTIE